MRVNMDSSILSDPRFKRLGKTLGVPFSQAVGACFFVWLACYERRSETLDAMDIDAAADIDGFASAMMAVGIAHEADGKVVVHGVNERIAFLQKQKDKASKGGNATTKVHKARENKAKAASAQAYAQASGVADAQADAPGAAQAYSPAPALSPALSPAPPPTPPKPPEGVCVRPEDFDEFVKAWNVSQLPGAGKITRDSIRAGFWQMRLADDYWRENWREGLSRASKSDRCRGFVKGWAGLMVDTFLKDSLILKRILEGEFDNHGANRPPPPPTVFTDPDNLPTNRIAPPPPKKERAA